VGKARVLPYCTVNMNGHGDEGAQWTVEIPTQLLFR
jgi:hypothetical protein